mmetsp:Transcript_62205/g.115448  ORF Transcript_62205/g.115448 Transcript_62205/m.115448 type:complete len:172 (-) Transcript_62205:24-539(-)
MMAFEPAGANTSLRCLSPDSRYFDEPTQNAESMQMHATPMLPAQASIPVGFCRMHGGPAFSPMMGVPGTGAAIPMQNPQGRSMGTMAPVIGVPAYALQQMPIGAGGFVANWAGPQASPDLRKRPGGMMESRTAQVTTNDGFPQVHNRGASDEQAQTRPTAVFVDLSYLAPQ